MRVRESGSRITYIVDLTDDAAGVMSGAMQPSVILDVLRQYPGWYTYAITLKYAHNTH